MKRIATLIVLFLAIKAPAQDFQRFEGGVILGVSASQIDGDTYAGYNKLGYSFTTFALYRINRVLSLQSGVTIIQKGAHSPPKSPFFRTVVNEAEVPVWLNIQPYPHLGGSLGLNFGYIYKAYYESSTYLSKEDLSIGNLDLSSYLSINYRISKTIMFKLASRYSLLPITRPIRGECWYKSIFLSWLMPHYLTSSPCWWTNTVTVGFEIKIF